MERYIAIECRRGRSGECDGFGPDGRWCDCDCHDKTNIFATLADARAWHAE